MVDGQGNACSFINSVYINFGSGLVVPDTGIVLQNRAALFSLEPDHPNAMAGGKRPYHTIIPAMATKDGELYLCYGVMGGFMQPQGHLQVMTNMVDYGMEPQAALNALRFQVIGDTVLIEEELPPEVIGGLQSMGHQLQMIRGHARVGMGGGQVIQRNPGDGGAVGRLGTKEGRVRGGVLGRGIIPGSNHDCYSGLPGKGVNDSNESHRKGKKRA